ncbi:MAG: phosphopantetheine-binding protein [Gammaproteobacteria bacterium]|nr:phosphopantetheine-binding protein [Gammaproteobacteria bacterium]
MNATREEIQAHVIAVLEEMTMDWELENEEAIGTDTRLIADLDFESIDIVQFILALEQRLNKKGLPFEKLFMQDDNYVEEMQVGQVVGFLQQNI